MTAAQKDPVPFDKDVWELYDLRTDFGHATDLAAKYPDKLKELQVLGARADPRDAVVDLLVPHARAGQELRRVGRRLLRPEGTVGEGIELGAHKSGGGFELIFRFYGPEKPLFDKTWKHSDIEEVK